jgi:nucleotide-binding universal stress UspA family protein
MSGIYPYSRSNAVDDFRHLRQKAAMQDLLARLTGKSSALLAFGEVSEALQVVGRAEHGLQEIRLDAIVGSVGRYDDFTRTFLPRQAHDAQRWASVKMAAHGQKDLPPIDVYQVGDAYFVLDGNHRVSIARQEGKEFIHARITKVQTRAPFSPNDQPDELLIKAEYADFLKRTGLDRLRPGADLLVTAPGQYRVLEDLIEIHRYCTETIEQCTLANPTAVARWYDEDYMPMVLAIREQGILRYFPGRSETDFYIFLLTNQAELRRGLGWEVRSEELVKLAEQFHPELATGRDRLFHQLRHLVVPQGSQAGMSKETWSERRGDQHHDDRLFSSLLVAVEPSQKAWTGLDQALVVAKREQASLYGLCLVQESAAASTEALAEAFNQRCHDAGVEGQFGAEMGSLSERIAQRGLLVDLVVLNCGLGADEAGKDAFTPEIAQVLRRCARPVLVVPGMATACQRILLAFDNHPRAKEALYVATYLSRQWGAALQVLSVIERGRSAEDATTYARQYLDQHAVSAEFSACDGKVPETILRIAEDQGSDLILMGSYGGGWLKQQLHGNVVNQVLEQAALPVLVCP